MASQTDANFDRSRYLGREIDLYAAHQAQFDPTTSYASTYVPHALEARSGQRTQDISQHSGEITNIVQCVSNELYFSACRSLLGGVLVRLATQRRGHPRKHASLDCCGDHSSRSAGQRVPFEGSSTYSKDFLKHDLPDRGNKAAAPGGAYTGQHPTAKFEGISAYKVGDLIATNQDNCKVGLPFHSAWPSFVSFFHCDSACTQACDGQTTAANALCGTHMRRMYTRRTTAIISGRHQSSRDRMITTAEVLSVPHL
jgi:hypothetical protein